MKKHLYWHKIELLKFKYEIYVKQVVDEVIVNGEKYDYSSEYR